MSGSRIGGEMNLLDERDHEMAVPRHGPSCPGRGVGISGDFMKG